MHELLTKKNHIIDIVFAPIQCWINYLCSMTFLKFVLYSFHFFFRLFIRRNIGGHKRWDTFTCIVFYTIFSVTILGQFDPGGVMVEDFSDCSLASAKIIPIFEKSVLYEVVKDQISRLKIIFTWLLFCFSSMLLCYWI